MTNNCVIVSLSINKEVIYSLEQWKLLDQFRSTARNLLNLLAKIPVGKNAIVYGSVARGDVSPSSDIDVLIPQPLPSYQIEQLLIGTNHQITQEKIVMATPNAPIKGVIELNKAQSVHIPLTPLSQRDLEFYTFGGSINLQQLNNDKRVVGITKNLHLVLPTKQGHLIKDVQAIPIQEILKHGISQLILKERLRVLTRRQKVGKTGVFVEELIDKDETIEQRLQELINSNPLVKKHFRRK